MTGSAVLDTVFGLMFVFYALALLCSGLVEMIANWVKKRAKYLIRGLEDLLLDTTTSAESGVQRLLTLHPLKNVGEELASYKSALVARTVKGQSNAPEITPETVIGHPLVLPFKHSSSLRAATRNPAYLPGPVFREVLADLLTWGKAGVTTADIEQRLKTLPAKQQQLKESLTSLLKGADGDAKKFLAATERWFNQQMERVTGSYKRWAKRWVIVIATVAVVLGGVDSIAIGRTLYANEETRASVVAAAEAWKICATDDDAAKCGQHARDFFTSSGLPLGPATLLPDPNAHVKWSWWVLKALGLLISIGAASLGAPFWYKLLDRVGSLRDTGRSPSQNG